MIPRPPPNDENDVPDEPEISTSGINIDHYQPFYRELDLDTAQIPYEQRDHAWYIAFGPYKNPRYALSVFVEHGGSGGTTAAPLAKKLFKKIIDRHEEREKIRNSYLNEI